MKHNLGKMLKFYILFSLTLLLAEDFSYTMKVNTQTPYVKEPILLTLDFNQTNHNIVLLLNFDLKKSDAYTFQRLDVKETDSHHNIKVRYTYLIYPLRSEEVSIYFTLIKKVTNDESVAYSFSGDRDNVKGLVTKDSQVTLPPVTLKVKALPDGTDIVGDFQLHASFEKHHAKAYEPIPFTLQIKGKGYLPLINNIMPKDLNVTLFTEHPVAITEHTLKGTQSTVTYSFALSHDQNFDLPSIAIQGFNPKTEKVYILKTNKQHFDISKESEHKLLDNIDNPAAFSMDWSWFTNFLSYLVVFAAGYLTAFSIKLAKKKNHQKPINALKEKIENCKDEKALLQILMATDSKKFNTIIESLENGLYKNAKINLNKLKQSAIEEVS